MYRLTIGVVMLAALSAGSLYEQVHAETVSTLAQQFTAGAPRGAPEVASGDEADLAFSALRAAEEDNRRLLALCIMGTAILALVAVLAMLYKRGASPENIVTGSGLVLVIFATVLVATLAKTDQQLTAPIGILGAIAGYLFGKSAKGAEADPKAGKAGSP